MLMETFVSYPFRERGGAKSNMSSGTATRQHFERFPKITQVKICSGYNENDDDNYKIFVDFPPPPRHNESERLLSQNAANADGKTLKQNNNAHAASNNNCVIKYEETF